MGESLACGEGAGTRKKKGRSREDYALVPHCHCLVRPSTGGLGDGNGRSICKTSATKMVPFPPKPRVRCRNADGGAAVKSKRPQSRAGAFWETCAKRRQVPLYALPQRQ
jgi:hypothetical protein